MKSAPTIVFLDAATVRLNDDIDLGPISALGELTIYDTTAPADVVERTAGHDVVIVNKVRITREAIEQLPDLKLICVMATGTDNVDSAAAADHGIPVRNVVGYGQYAVAQHTIALMLALAGRLVDYVADVRRGAWDASPFFTLLSYPTVEVAGRTLGLIGFGSIGRAVAKTAAALGMTVRVHTRSPISDAPYESEPLDDVVAGSDVLSIHAPLTSETRGLIGAQRIRSMRRGAFIINTSRGGIVDERAALAALESGHLGGVALDVLDGEPPHGNPLTSRGDLNLIVTPHAAWSAIEARQRLVAAVALNIAEWIG